METKKLSIYKTDGSEEFHDTGVPIDLFEAFSKIKEDLGNKSEGIYECTPMILDHNINGVAVGILEKRDGITRKSEYTLTLTKR